MALKFLQKLKVELLIKFAFLHKGTNFQEQNAEFLRT